MRKQKTKVKINSNVSIWWQKFLIFLFRKIFRLPIMLIISLIVFSLWFYYLGPFKNIESYLYSKFISYNQAANLTLKNVYLEGQKHTKTKEVMQKLNVKIGQPILLLDIWQIKENLESLDWVEYATVERQYPSTLNITIIEKSPIAIWQNNGKLHLIDHSGKTINESSLKNYKNLIILVGKDAPSFTSSLFEILKTDSDIYNQISSAIRVGNRRWNLRLKNGIEIKLPEDNLAEAWEYLQKMNQDQPIKNSNVKTIDLRVKNKIYIEDKS